MQRIEDAQVSARQGAEAILKEYEQATWLPFTTIPDANPLTHDPIVHAFLLASLEKPRNELVRFRSPSVS